MPVTFLGGIKINEHKNTSSLPVAEMASPEYVSIALKQHIGIPCKPLVSVGDAVEIGQPIGDDTDGLCVPVHASVSGVVESIEKKQVSGGDYVDHILIHNDFQNTVYKKITPCDRPLIDLKPEEIVSMVRNAGIVGMGGASFPTYKKIESSIGKAVHVVINCCECEPYITVNHRILLEHPDEIIKGVKILIHAMGAQDAYIVTLDNKEDGAEAIAKEITDEKLIKLKVFATKYPQGDERQLVYSLTGKELPPGELPIYFGCVIFNAETAINVYRSIATGMPVVSKLLTVDGDAIKEKRNLSVPIGTCYRDIIKNCGGTKKDPEKIICGGPLMGVAQWTDEGVVTKSTSALLVFSKADDTKGACIHCGRCAWICPMHLLPLFLNMYSVVQRYDMCEKYDAMACVSCGCCSYVCPGKVPLVQRINDAKSAIAERRRALAKK